MTGTVLLLALQLQLRGAAATGTDVTIRASDAEMMGHTLESLFACERLLAATQQALEAADTELAELREREAARARRKKKIRDWSEHPSRVVGLPAELATTDTKGAA